jgi:hypothetical protein
MLKNETMTTLNTIENDLNNVMARMDELGKDVHMIQTELKSLKLAEEKGLTKIGTKVKDAHDGLVSIIAGQYPEYRGGGYDSLVIESVQEQPIPIPYEIVLNGIKHPYGVTNLYYQGKWAEIVPDKKKLPKTKKELSALFEAYFLTSISLNEFLNDYED